MITRAEVEKLGALHVVEPTMLSLYLAVPPQPAPLSLLAARTDELTAVAEAAGAGRPAGKQDGNSVREKLALCGRDWPGRMVAIFVPGYECDPGAGPEGRGSGRVLGEDLLQLGDEPERFGVPALEDVAPEDEACGAGIHRLTPRWFSAGDPTWPPP